MKSIIYRAFSIIALLLLPACDSPVTDTDRERAGNEEERAGSAEDGEVSPWVGTWIDMSVWDGRGPTRINVVTIFDDGRYRSLFLEIDPGANRKDGELVYNPVGTNLIHHETGKIDFATGLAEIDEKDGEVSVKPVSVHWRVKNGILICEVDTGSVGESLFYSRYRDPH